MTPASHPRRAAFAGALALVLVLSRMTGALLMWLIGDDSLPSVPTTVDEPTEASSGENPASASSGSLPYAGRTAPAFTLKDPDGRLISLSDSQGSPVLINFWATWCGPCEVEMPAIQAAFQKHQDDGLSVRAIAVDDTAANVRQFFDKRGLTFQPLLDDGTVARAYPVFGIPTSFFPDRTGKSLPCTPGC